MARTKQIRPCLQTISPRVEKISKSLKKRKPKKKQFKTVPKIISPVRPITKAQLKKSNDEAELVIDETLTSIIENLDSSQLTEIIEIDSPVTTKVNDKPKTISKINSRPALRDIVDSKIIKFGLFRNRKGRGIMVQAIFNTTDNKGENLSKYYRFEDMVEKEPMLIAEWISNLKLLAKTTGYKTLKNHVSEQLPELYEFYF